MSVSVSWNRFRRLLLIALPLTMAGLPWGCAPSEPKVSVVMKPAEEGEAVAAAGGAGGEGGGAAAEGGGGAGGVGDVAGTVVFDGTPPAPQMLINAGADVRDKAVCAAVAIPNESLLVDPETKGIANVFVYLEKAPAGAKSADVSGDAIFDQKGCRFKPHALIVRTKQTVEVLNDDPLLHNTHTYPVRNSPFNQGIPINERKGVPLVYTKPEQKPIEVKCDVHAWMIAYHLPLDHSFAGLTDEKGKFEIKGLPAGVHKFKIWHEKGGLLEREYKVTVKGGETANAAVSVPAAKFGS